MSVHTPVRTSPNFFVVVPVVRSPSTRRIIVCITSSSFAALLPPVVAFSPSRAFMTNAAVASHRAIAPSDKYPSSLSSSASSFARIELRRRTIAACVRACAREMTPTVVRVRVFTRGTRFWVMNRGGYVLIELRTVVTHRGSWMRVQIVHAPIARAWCVDAWDPTYGQTV